MTSGTSWAAPPLAQPVPVAAQIRVLSWVIDIAVIAAATTVTSFASHLLGLLVLVGGAPAYYIYAELNGGTIGHRVIGARVVDVVSLTPASITALGIRSVVVAGLLVPFAIPFFANAALMWRPGWVSVSDACSHTTVVRR